MLSIYLGKVCRCQRENHQRIMNWFTAYSGTLLRYLGPFFGNIVLGWQQMRESTKRRGVKHPGCCRHTLLPQDRNPLWSPRLGGRYCRCREGETESQNRDLIRCHHPPIRKTFYFFVSMYAISQSPCMWNEMHPPFKKKKWVTWLTAAS